MDTNLKNRKPPFVVCGSILLLCISLTTFGSLGAAPAEILLQEDFNQQSKTGLAGKLLQSKYIQLAPKAGPDGSAAIRVSYVPYSRGSNRVLARHALSRQVSSATLSFNVCFEEDFDFRRGGKLHGLGPNTPITGGKGKQPNGWSARLMFLADGKTSTYIYDQNKKKKYGSGDASRSTVFRKGKWYRVDLQVTLNSSPQKNDGSVILLVNGRTIAKSRRLTLWAGNAKESMISNFLFSTFHGGHDPKWSPLGKNGKPATVHALFDNFLVREGKFVTRR